MKLFAEARKSFSNPALAPEGLVDVSDDLSVERLLEAYSFGIFPWPHGDLPTLWFCPESRGVLDFSQLHIPRSLQKLASKNPFRFSFDQRFADVMIACANQPRADQSGTWITERMMRAYIEFHRAGYAHSLEVWDDDELVGGIYGVWVAGVFSGESMFFKKPNASKLALVRLIEFLKTQGVSWMDIQMVSDLSLKFGGQYIQRSEFLRRLELEKSRARKIEFKI